MEIGDCPGVCVNEMLYLYVIAVVKGYGCYLISFFVIV